MQSRRITSLDGLRGLAALVVVVHHGFLSLKVFDDSATASRASVTGLLARSPLHAFWAGTEAVYVFFVLSGFVLTLPVLRASGYGWRSYYVQRMLRLYLPVWGALVFALVLFAVVGRDIDPGDSHWVGRHDVAVSLGSLVKDFTLTDPSLVNSPLWSLRVEVLFSLLLPAYVWAAVKLARWAVPVSLLSAAVAGVLVVHGHMVVGYLPIFLIGCLAAVRLEDLLRFVGGLPGWVGPTAAVGSLLLLTATYWAPGPGSARVAVAVVGAALLVALFIAWAPAARLGNHRLVAWLGVVSFSLYLVHEPVLVSLAILSPSSILPLVMAAGVVLSLGVAWVFYRLVECPAHRVSRRAGRSVARSLREPVKVA